jgi:hypothetical protein
MASLVASFKVAVPCRNRLNGGSQQAHSEHVQRLPTHVFGAHIDDALQTKTGTDRRSSHAMLTRTGFSNDPLLAHTQGQQSLTEGIVDFVRTGVVEVFTLQPNAWTTIGTACSERSDARLRRAVSLDLHRISATD